LEVVSCSSELGRHRQRGTSCWCQGIPQRCYVEVRQLGQRTAAGKGCCRQQRFCLHVCLLHLIATAAPAAPLRLCAHQGIHGAENKGAAHSLKLVGNELNNAAAGAHHPAVAQVGACRQAETERAGRREEGRR
jgi:hypothetical protein